MDTRRDETDAERYDRNWTDLVQELRVAQTGVQVLAGFLLTLPFSSILGIVVNDTAGVVAAGAVLVLVAGACVLLPLSLLRRGTRAS